MCVVRVLTFHKTRKTHKLRRVQPRLLEGWVAAPSPLLASIKKLRLTASTRL
jgi:hypothetical protein